MSKEQTLKFDKNLDVRKWGAAWLSNDFVAGAFSYSTDAPWPTTLPGVPE